MERPMQKLNDLSRSLTPLNPDGTLIAVIEMSQSSWLVAGVVPGIERHPLKKLEPNEGELLRLLVRWRAEATKMGCTITRIAVAYEAGRDGFWLARWLRARDIETYVIHPTSVAVSREHRRAKTDRLDTGLLKRVFIGWLRGEPDHCHMAAIPTLAEEDAKRPNRERERLVCERTRIVNRIKSCLVRFGVRNFKPSHRRALNSLANRFRIGGIVLIALDVRLHVLRRHQSHLVAKRAQLPRPVVRRRARLQANQTGRQSTEERQNLRTPKLLAQNRRSLCIDPVHLKNRLR